MPHPYGGMQPSQSVADLSQRQSMMGDPMPLNHGMRTMSMVQPPPSFQGLPHPGTAPSIRIGSGYTPSIAPSERSNVGLPGRYRPVSQAPTIEIPGLSQRASTMSGALSSWPIMTGIPPYPHVLLVTFITSAA